MKRSPSIADVALLTLWSSPPETHDYAPQMSEEGSGVQAVQQKQIVKPFLR